MTKMSRELDLEIRHKHQEGYLLAEVSGRRSYRSVVNLTRTIFQTCLEHEYQKVIIDVRELRGWLKPIESMKIVSGEFKDLVGKGLSAAAILDRELPKATFFFEMVARNRGYNLRIFTQARAAIDWILSQETKFVGNPRGTPNNQEI